MWVLGRQSFSAGNISHTHWMPAGVFYTHAHTHARTHAHTMKEHLPALFTGTQNVRLLTTHVTSTSFKAQQFNLQIFLKIILKWQLVLGQKRKHKYEIQEYAAERWQKNISRMVTVNHRLNLDILHHITYMAIINKVCICQIWSALSPECPCFSRLFHHCSSCEFIGSTLMFNSLVNYSHQHFLSFCLLYEKHVLGTKDATNSRKQQPLPSWSSCSRNRADASKQQCMCSALWRECVSRPRVCGGGQASPWQIQRTARGTQLPRL